MTKFLKAFDIQVLGEPKYEGRRFSTLSNKDDIKLVFNKNALWFDAVNDIGN